MASLDFPSPACGDFVFMLCASKNAQFVFDPLRQKFLAGSLPVKLQVEEKFRLNRLALDDFQGHPSSSQLPLFDGTYSTKN